MIITKDKETNVNMKTKIKCLSLKILFSIAERIKGPEELMQSS